MLGKNNVVYVYRGQLLPDASNFHTTTFKGIRDTIIQMKKDVINAMCMMRAVQRSRRKQEWAILKLIIPPDPNWKNACLDKDLVIVIKPDDEATYKNTIDIWMKWLLVLLKRYAMVDLFPAEKELIKKTEGRKLINCYNVEFN